MTATLATDAGTWSLAPILKAAQTRLFAAKDDVCLDRARLVTEAWQRFDGEPTPIKRAKATAHIMQHMTLDADTNPVFAGAISSGPRRWMLIPEHGMREGGQVLIEHDDLDGHTAGRIPPDIEAYWQDRRAAGGLGHLAIDQSLVVTRGLGALLEELVAADGQGTPDQQRYREGMRIAIEGVIAWAHRWADLAAKKAQSERDPAVAACHRRVAEACRHVPERRARNLFEGLQAMLIAHMAIHLEGHHMSVSIGRPDVALRSFAAEAAAGPDRAADLCAAFALKVAENAYTGKGSLTQCITVGGADRAGHDESNAVTLAFLEGFVRAPVADPHLFLRWHEDLAEPVKSKAIAMLSAGRSMPLIVHDQPTAGGFIDAGMSEEDAWDYCVIGCNELGIPGRCFDSATPVGAGSFNDLELLSRLLLSSEGPMPLDSMDALLASLEDAYRNCFSTIASRPAAKQRIADDMPTPFTSALMRGGVARGCDLMVGMPYDIPCIYTRGLSNAANALAAIEKLVFVDQSHTLGQLVQAMRDNLSDKAVRDALASAPKWGNDDAEADQWAARLVELRERALDLAVRETGAARPLVCHVVRSLHYLDGKRIGASPDGRRAGEPVGDSLGGICGTMKQGPTAMLSSVLKLDARKHFAGGTNLNLSLPSGQASPAVLRPLVEGFFAQGGQEIQVAVLSSAKLKAAQANPAAFGDLVVRIAGLNARFVELSKAEQSEIIARAQEAEVGV